jgi:hypothetical protein
MSLLSELKEEDERKDLRPSIAGYTDKKQDYLSAYETEESERLLREYTVNKNETILDLTLNEIIENTVTRIAEFSNDYTYKLYEVDLEFKLHEEDHTFYSNLKKYILALSLYLGENDNLLYFGILLVMVAIILYFFNITSSE